jgi:plasmid stabilization system protein ParE
MSKCVLSEGADLDLDEIWEYIAQDNIDAADRWIDKLFDAFERLARNPGMGHTRKDLTDHEVLFWPVAAYLIIDRKHGRQIEIVAVTQGARDIPSFLRRRTRSHRKRRPLRNSGRLPLASSSNDEATRS